MTVYFRPCGDLTKAPKPRSECDLALYAFLEERTGLSINVDQDNTVDYEDWMEPAKMLEAAIKSDLAILILPRAELRSAVANPIANIEGQACRDMLIGRQLASDPHNMKYFDLGWPVANNCMANHYPELKSFRDNAGRKVRLADMPGEPNPATRHSTFQNMPSSTALGFAMAQFAEEECFIKQVYPAKKLPLIKITPEEDIRENESLFFDEVGFHFSRFEGDRASLLVQEKVTMTHETRFFIVGTKVACGAACIEANTPQVNNIGSYLLPNFETQRNSGVQQTDFMARMILHDFAISMAYQISQEAPQMRNYVLDLALGCDQKPLIIELNPIAQSGLYGVSAELLFDAIFREAKKQPHQKGAHP